MDSKRNSFDKFDLKHGYVLITGAAGLLGIEHARAILSANGKAILWDLDSRLLDLAIEIN